MCQACRTLVHADELDRISERARQLEKDGLLWEAREQWVHALLLVPGLTKQADWIKTHVAELQTKAELARIPEPENKWASKLGPAAPVAVLLVKSKAVLAAVFKLKFLLSFAGFFGVYWALYGMKFGLGFAVLILVHELGHYIDVKRRGLPADMPVFLPGLGAYVRWRALEFRFRHERR